jgi:16S rRNA (guanine527-N7)-methyltransferase
MIRLTIAKAIDMAKHETLCDMGAGAGFPSIPLKIIFPHLKITIIDSLNKRINFIEKLCKKLSIDYVTAIHDRVETYALKNTQKFDIVTARALGSLSLILEMGVPMTKTNGHFIAYKSRLYMDELDKSQQAIKVLNVNLSQIVELKLPQDMGDRTLLDFVKIKHINGYPRSYSIMEKKPL